MTQVPFDNAKYFEVEDAEIGIILFHAYTGTPNDVQLLARKLNRAGYTVLCPQFSGHGTPNVYDIVRTDVTKWETDARQAVEWMTQQGFEKVLAFGLSLGGIYASWSLTQEDLNLSGGGVFNSPVLTSQTVSLEKSFTSYAKRIYNHFHTKEKYDQDIPEILALHHEQMAALDQFKATFEENLEHLTLPYYIAQSGRDEFIDAERVKFLQVAVKDAPALVDFNYFPENTHVITVNRDRKEFETSVMEFIEKVTQEV